MLAGEMQVRQSQIMSVTESLKQEEAVESSFQRDLIGRHPFVWTVYAVSKQQGGIWSLLLKLFICNPCFLIIPNSFL